MIYPTDSFYDSARSSFHCSLGPGREEGARARSRAALRWLMHVHQTGHRSTQWSTFIRKAFTPPRLLKTLLLRIYPQQVLWPKSVEGDNFCCLETAVGWEGCEWHSFPAWERDGLACKPGPELLLQPLHFKRKWLQIHFARDVIYLSLFSLEKDCRTAPLRSVQEDFKFRFSKKSVPNQPSWAGIGYAQRQESWCVVWAGYLCPAARATGGVAAGLSVVHRSPWALLESCWTAGTEPRRRAIRSCWGHMFASLFVGVSLCFALRAALWSQKGWVPNHFLFQKQSGLLQFSHVHSQMALTVENGFLIKGKKGINKYLTSKQRVSNPASLDTCLC